ncbi:bifunctional DNA-formamidopyrimidine glycosylase/DNA-(apurinic or apyrimidinic site) lyase [Desulfuromonas sp. KJ2020]|uniref:bifunctional DNA-formamidopyrimidine glycosylase/DNA-(apurinic or apyrimidinic site) lyase n=1 Tax=Desulfuromonas sp. KJ2020 TaxID=2919173 RepID=UPI0020A74C3E|nr:bifunctional DNA-formamidopyrimidine glycosylase/DNA-(apurinic or apyrimidinic site) lyase [Desulfuromonas sp. KJ2020]MCP3177993.1 bifunctional DNA-formamidopyrimidine glycosylase/DNA-(apurinic or apyrimidinic site) lyase [Desulfuromonas sp. KJ2020]
MPELPEVEITRQGISAAIQGRQVRHVVLRNADLRWPVDPRLVHILPGQVVHRVERRAKFLLLRMSAGTLLVHLGMSGFFRMVSPDSPAHRHDHLDLVFENDICLRYNDVRRFGSFLWVEGDPLCHSLLADLGPEPDDARVDGAFLQDRFSGRSAPVKNVLMDQKVVAGLGNIYANEALFAAGISPLRAAGQLTRVQCDRLSVAVKKVLSRAIESGQQSLHRFYEPVTGEKPGYFPFVFAVYGRENQNCSRCGKPITKIVQAGRSTYFCPSCQA